ncbi:transcriptional regulator [Spirochaetia bacterium]|nr:transcriptional regulator [Spirochaetia bacterium]
MKSIGDKLRSGRESKAWTIEDVARETNIAKKYLTALEEEDFSAFAAEAYMLGFLKNYSEYLGLDTNELLRLYRILKIQEQPIPVNELLHSPPQFPKIIAVVSIIIVSLGLAGGAVYFIINKFKGDVQDVNTPRVPVEYIFSDDFFEKRFYKDDSILVPIGNNTYKIVVSVIGEVITITTPAKNIKLALNDEAQIDLNSDGSNELTIVASDYQIGNADMGVQLRFTANKTPYSTAADSTAKTEEYVQDVPVEKSQVIFNSANPYPFTLQIVFQSYCMFRWEILREAGRDGRNERYFIRSDELNLQAQNGVRLWVSNAAALKIVVSGAGRTVPVEIGNAGEVVVSDIYWTRDEDGRYKLIQARLEM